MSVAVSCPTCGKSYNLNERLVGKKVRCKHCADTFPVELDAVLPVGGPAASAEPATQFRSADPDAPRPAGPAPDDDLPEVEAFDEKPKPKRKESTDKEPPTKKGGFPIWLCVLGGVACLMLLVCGALGLGAVLLIRSAYQAGQNISAAVNTPPSRTSAWGITAPPTTMAEALEDATSNDWYRRQAGAEWLRRAPYNAADQPKVSQALEPLLTDGNPLTKTAAAEGLVVWAGKENAPALLRCLESNDGPTADPALRALIRLREPRAARTVASQLPFATRRVSAVRALDGLGKVAEPEVVKYVFHPDQDTREQAMQLLRNYGTSNETILNQALLEVNSKDPTRAVPAAQWLAQTPVIDRRREEVARALMWLLKDQNTASQAVGAKAAKRWGTKDTVQPLVKIVTDSLPIRGFSYEHSAAAMEALVELNDERGYWPIAQWAGHQYPREKELGKKHLLAIGVAAEPVVVAHLTDANLEVRKTAWRALGVIGPKANVGQYTALANQEKDFFTRTEAQSAIQTINARP
jgi:HEAT repeat protein